MCCWFASRKQQALILSDVVPWMIVEWVTYAFQLLFCLACSIPYPWPLHLRIIIYTMPGISLLIVGGRRNHRQTPASTHSANLILLLGEFYNSELPRCWELGGPASPLQPSALGPSTQTRSYSSWVRNGTNVSRLFTQPTKKSGM